MKRLGTVVPASLLALLPATGSAGEAALSDYAALCAAEIGTVPGFDCTDGVVVPVTVGGRTPDRYVAGMTCDRPALLPNGDASDGQCVPYTRVLDLSSETAQISVMCRRKKIRSAESPLFDEINVVAHNPVTGATCWFKAEGSEARPLVGNAVPSPHDAATADFWLAPPAVVRDGCGECHDNDPFLYTPYVAQVWSEIPSNPFGSYFHVGAELGFDNWPVRSIALRDSTCTGCHRIGTAATCGELTRLMSGTTLPTGADESMAGFPASHAMPPEPGPTIDAWRVTHAKSVGEILSCCADPRQRLCNTADIPGVRQHRRNPAGSVEGC